MFLFQKIGSTTPLLMPMPAYLMTETPKSSPVWWNQQLEILASRQNFASLNDFLIQFPNMELKQKATFTTMLISQYVQTLEYVSDKTNGRAIEMFGDALAMKCGDCEDLALAIKQMMNSYSEVNHILPVLKEMQDITRQYVYLFCLEGVTATHTQNDKDFKEDINGAHAAIKALPRDYFGECVGRWDPLHALAQLKVTDIYKNKLPVLVGEGTGMLFPVGKSDGHEYLRKQIGDAVKSLQVIKKYLYNAPTDSKFYKQIMLGATAEFMDNYRCATFYFTTKQVSDKGETQFGKGVPFSLLVQRSSEVILRPASFNEPIKVPLRITTSTGSEQCAYNPEFTMEQTLLMQNVVRTRMPPPNFEPVNVEKVGPVIDTDHSRIAHPILDSLCVALKAMGPSTMAALQIKTQTQNKVNQQTVANGTDTLTGSQKQDPVKTKISYFINPQYLTKSFCENLINSFKSLIVVTDASYLMERHLDDHVMYRLTVEYLDTHFNESPAAVSSTSDPTGKTQAQVSYHFQKPTSTGFSLKVK